MEMKYYVVVTYSGYEAKVKTSLLERIKQNSLESSFGDILIPKRGMIGEGTSSYYISGEPTGYSRSADTVSKVIEKACMDYSVPSQTGSIWSTDAPYRETAQQILSLKQQGVMAVDMESSALFTASRFRQVETGALLVVSDELASLKWKAGFTDPRFHTSREHVSEILVHACNMLINQP